MFRSLSTRSVLVYAFARWVRSRQRILTCSNPQVPGRIDYILLVEDQLLLDPAGAEGSCVRGIDM